MKFDYNNVKQALKKKEGKGLEYRQCEAVEMIVLAESHQLEEFNSENAGLFSDCSVTGFAEDRILFQSQQIKS